MARAKRIIPGGIAEASRLFSGRMSTAILKYPSGRFGLVGSIPGELTVPDDRSYTPGARKSIAWDTEQAVIDALLGIGVTRFQLSDCSWYVA